MMETYRLSYHHMNPHNWTSAFDTSLSEAVVIANYLLYFSLSYAAMGIVYSYFRFMWFIDLCHTAILFVFIVYFLYKAFIKVYGIFLLGLWRTWCMTRLDKDALLAFE